MFRLLSSISVDDLNRIVAPIIEICKILIPVMLSVVGSIGGLYCILLGVKYAKADDPQEHEKAKNGLKNAIIGFILIFILLIMLQVGLPILSEWLAANEGM
jgi:hypothetical protein